MNSVTKAIVDESARIVQNAFYELEDAKSRYRFLEFYSEARDKVKELARQRKDQAALVYFAMCADGTIAPLMAAAKLYPDAEVRVIRNFGKGRQNVEIESWYEADRVHLHIYIESMYATDGNN